MRNDLTELWRYRGLLWKLVRRELNVRYRNSRLGFLWSIAPPLMQVACINFALRQATTFARDFPSYPAFVLVAMIPWTFFQTAVLDASQSILLNFGVIKKVYLPREIIPLAYCISNFIHFLISWAVFFIIWWGFMRNPILISTLWLPYLLLVQFMFVAGLSLIVSSLNVFYEDVKYILTVLMSLGLFVLPIMFLAEQAKYSTSSLLLGWRFDLYMLNPLVSLITGYRKALLENPSPEVLNHHPSLPLDVANLLTTGGLSFAFLVLAYAYFNHTKWKFTERP